MQSTFENNRTKFRCNVSNKISEIAGLLGDVV